MKVAVLSGGRSSEHEISLLSGKAVAEGLRQAGHEVFPVLIDRDGHWSWDEAPVSILPASGLSSDGTIGSKLSAVEVVFPVLHGPFGEDGVTQGALETAGLPYVGIVSARVRCLHGQADPEAPLRGQRSRAGRFRPGPRSRSGGFGRGLEAGGSGNGMAALGQARPARVERRHNQGRATRGPRCRGRPGRHARPTGDHRSELRGS